MLMAGDARALFELGYASRRYTNHNALVTVTQPSGSAASFQAIVDGNATFVHLLDGPARSLRNSVGRRCSDAETLTFFRILDFQHSGLLHAHFVWSVPKSAMSWREFRVALKKAYSRSSIGLVDIRRLDEEPNTSGDVGAYLAMNYIGKLNCREISETTYEYVPKPVRPDVREWMKLQGYPKRLIKGLGFGGNYISQPNWSGETLKSLNDRRSAHAKDAAATDPGDASQPDVCRDSEQRFGSPAEVGSLLLCIDYEVHAPIDEELSISDLMFRGLGQSTLVRDLSEITLQVATNRRGFRSPKRRQYILEYPNLAVRQISRSEQSVPPHRFIDGAARKRYSNPHTGILTPARSPPTQSRCKRI